MSVEIPPVEDILEGLRQSGGKLKKYVRQNFPKEQRAEAQLAILQAIEEEGDKAQEEFERIRSLSKRAALLEAEDSLTSMVKAGRADSMRAIQTALLHLNKVKANVEQDDDGLDDKLSEWG